MGAASLVLGSDTLSESWEQVTNFQKGALNTRHQQACLYVQRTVVFSNVAEMWPSEVQAQPSMPCSLLSLVQALNSVTMSAVQRACPSGT
jgi:hypothetical protein